MKKLNKLFILLIALFMFSGEVNAAKNPYKENLSWGGVNCTWYAWQKVYDETGVALAGFGNARDWYKDAEKKGYTVGSEPRAKAVVVWDNYLNYGHVGYVERVEGDNIYVWDTSKCYRKMTKEENDKYLECLITNTTSEEDSYKCDHLLIREQIPCVFSGKVGDNNLVGYIYTDIPRKTSQSNNTKPEKPATNETTPKKEEVVKSSNNYLNSLIITNIPFEFNKDVLEYNLEVQYEVEAVEISATLEDSKAKVDGIGSLNLNVGTNTLKVIVTAEDDSKKEYVVNINRLEKEIPQEVEENKKEEEKTSESSKEKFEIKWYFWLIPSILIVCGILVIIILKKKGKNK